MKKWVRRQLTRNTIWLLIFLMLAYPVSTWAASLFTREIPSTVTIISAPQANLRVYDSAACTTEITSIAWGQVMKGNTAQRIVYVKNTGEVNFTSVNTTSDLVNTTGVLAGTPNGYALSVGAKQAVTLSLQIMPTASDGTVNFTALFAGE